MIDDLNMSHKDKYNHSSAIELLRQWMDYGKWYNLPSIFLKQIKEICFCSSLSTQKKTSSTTGLRDLVDERCSWHWVGIGITNFESSHIEQIQSIYLKRAFSHVHGNKVDYPELVIHASISFMEMYNRALRPSPTTFLKRIN